MLFSGLLDCSQVVLLGVMPFRAVGFMNLGPGLEIAILVAMSFLVIAALLRKPKRRCRRCAEINPSQARFCRHCGAPLE